MFVSVQCRFCVCKKITLNTWCIALFNMVELFGCNIKFGTRSSDTDHIRCLHHLNNQVSCYLLVHFCKVSDDKRSGRQTHIADIPFSWFLRHTKTGSLCLHVEQHLLFCCCCCCWSGWPFIWTRLEGFLSRAAWLPTLLHIRHPNSVRRTHFRRRKNQKLLWHTFSWSLQTLPRKLPPRWWIP